MLVLICGLPRAGKTTYSKQFENKYKVLHLDNTTIKNVRDTVSQTTDDIVVEGVFHESILRKHLVSRYKGNYKKCIWLDTPTEIKQTRYKYKKCLEFPFEPPTYEEGWDEIIVLK